MTVTGSSRLAFCTSAIALFHALHLGNEYETIYCHAFVTCFHNVMLMIAGEL